MKVYMYKAALYCFDCGLKLLAELPLPEGYDPVIGESSYDSDDFPKGPNKV